MPPKKKTEQGTDFASVVKNLTSNFGEGTIVEMSEDAAKDHAVQVIPTGVIGIDIALGRGGLPKGRIVEIYGPESSGKTSLALSVIASAQRLLPDKKIVYIDAEHALDVEYAHSLGVNTNHEFYLSQPDNGEQALEIADKLVQTGEVSVMVIDSVAALTPRSEIEGEMGDANVGKQARMMSQALRKITAHVSSSKTLVIFINQLREKIGVMFGSPETTTGGKALKFYASVRLDIRSSKNIEDGDITAGRETVVKVVKNKIAPPFKKAEVKTFFGEGISRADSLITEAVNFGIVSKNAAWYDWDGQKFQNKTFRSFLNDNPEAMEGLYAKVSALAFPKEDENVAEAPATEEGSKSTKKAEEEPETKADGDDWYDN